MVDKKIGRQTPTTALILPYEETKGNEAIEIYKKTGRTPREWQERLIYDIMALNNSNLWTHSTFGYSVPRRNGKTEDVIMRMLFGIMNGERVLYTAHMISTSHSVFETICALLESADIKYASVKAKGQENIRLYNESGKAYKLSHLINFRTRSNSGGLGEGYDTLIIDEAQEYTIDQESALKYVVSASENPQIIMLGTPPTAVSKGTVFSKLRENVLQGKSKNIGWSEWSVDIMHDVNDIDAWYETNPSLGCGLTERVIENEITSDDVDFNIQRLGHWLSYSQASLFSAKEWSNLKIDEVPNFQNKLFVGVDYGKDGKNVALSIATKLNDGNIFVEVIDCQPVRNGNLWIINFLKSADVESVVIDGANGQQLLVNDIKEYGIKTKIILPKVVEIIESNAKFEQGIIADKNIRHNAQPGLSDVIENVERRAIGTSGGFGYKAILSECEIALLDSVVIAYWLCSKNKVKKKMKIWY